MGNTRPPVDYIERTRSQYEELGFPPYRWVESESPPPFARVRTPLSESRVGLIASGGIYVAGQIAFHFADDLTAARKDPNAVFPIDTLRRLASEGHIAGLADDAYTFMGGIYSSRKVRDVLAPELARRVAQDQVDLVLLVPV